MEILLLEQKWYWNRIGEDTLVNSQLGRHVSHLSRKGNSNYCSLSQISVFHATFQVNSYMTTKTLKRAVCIG